MDSQTVTNEMLYEYLKAFKLEVGQRFEQVDKRFALMEQRLDQMDKRFALIEQRLDHLEKRIDRVEEMLMDIWKSKDKVAIGFSRGFLLINAFISAMVSGVVSFAMSK